MSFAPIQFYQIVYGKLVQYPGGAIVTLNEFHHCGHSAGLPQELILACTPKQIGIGVAITGWLDYPWLKEQPGWAARMVSIADQEWMVAVRATAFNEEGEGGRTSARQHSQAHYLITPLAEWRAEALPSLLPNLRAEPMTADNDELAPITISEQPDDLALDADWLTRLEPVLKALLSGQNVGWQARALLDGFLNDARICLAALPDAVACRLPLGAALGLGGDDFALCHGIGVATALRYSPPRPDPVWVGGAIPDLSPGERYLAWMREQFARAQTTGELHAIVQREWPRHANPAADHCALDWRKAVCLLDQSVIEATTVRNIVPCLEDPLAGRDLPAIAELENRIYLLQEFLARFAKPQAQRHLLSTTGWAEAWQAVSPEGGILAESVQAALGIGGPLTANHLRFLQEQQLISDWIKLIAGRIHADLPQVTDPAPWLALFAQGILPDFLGRQTHRSPWVHLVFRTAGNAAVLCGGLQRLGPFNPLAGLSLPDQSPDQAAAELLGGETAGSEHAAEFARAILRQLGSSPLGALLFWGELPADVQPPLAGSNPDFAAALLAQIAKLEGSGGPTGATRHWLVAYALLNLGSVKSLGSSAVRVLARFLGPLTEPVLGLPAPRGPGREPVKEELANLLKCLRVMPMARAEFWANALAEVARRRILPEEDLVKCLDTWIEATDHLAHIRAPALLSWHLFFTGRGSKPDQTASPAPAGSPRWEWTRLYYERRKEGVTDPWPLLPMHGEFDLYFHLLQHGWKLTGKPSEADLYDRLAVPIAELADINAGSATEALWQALLDKMNLSRETGWRILWRILAAKRPLRGGPPPVVDPDKAEGKLCQNLSAHGTVLLELGGMRVPIGRLDRVEFVRTKDEFVPPEAEPDKKGVLSVQLRRETRHDPPEIPAQVRLSLNELFALAQSAHDTRCKRLRGSLFELARSEQIKTPKSLGARITGAVKGAFVEPRTYAQLRKNCQ